MNITFDAGDLSHLAEELQKLVDELPAAVSRAINRAGDAMTTTMGRELAEATGLGVRDLHSDFEVERATSADPTYTMTVPSRQTTLGEYQPHPTRQGVSARPWGKRRVFPHTFDVRGEVYRRVGKARYPIEELFGPNVAKEAASAEIEQAIRNRVMEVLPERLAHEIGRLWLPKAGGGSP